MSHSDFTFNDHKFHNVDCFYNTIEKKTTSQNHASYIQSISDNLRARYWNMGSRNVRGREGREWTGGPGELNSCPTLEIIL